MTCSSLSFRPPPVASAGLIIFLLSPLLTKAMVLSSENDMESNLLSSIQPVEDCITIQAGEGEYQFASEGSLRTCGLYFSAQPNKRIKLTFQYADVKCVNGGLIAVVDGWELNGHLLPSQQDHPKSNSQRIHEFCGNQRPLHHYLSSQNVIMVQYRVPQAGQGFILKVEFVENLTPCNILLQGESGIITTTNYGLKMNCSVTTLFPPRIDILSVTVGKIRTLQTKCVESNMGDYVEITGSNQLESSSNSPGFISLCGVHRKVAGDESEDLFANVLCAATTVRLVSSGKYDNRLQLHFSALSDDDTAHFMCQIP